ncbi:Nuclear envelope-associated protein 2 [Sesamum angolense]|uniref:Nuclear envelope-associated protein 2 n=1 Tax=Sesamum angolense TaxID=2727404 RepID=A0AAE1X8G8_9LAMI|nr:Nuclear envelope-associated protein 2 [Sesamum angolense]
MSASERQAPPSTVMVVREVDPLLKDLSEKKQSFRRNVVSLAAELKEEAETKAKIMEEKMSRLQKDLEQRNIQLQASTSAAEMYVKELDDVRSQLTATKATADVSALSAQSAQLQCSALVKELEEKNYSLKEHALRAGSDKDCELRKILDEVSPRNFDKINKLLKAKDEEIATLRDEIKIMSAHWKLKTKELESQLEKHHRADQELKKKVLKLEFCLQEARSQTRKLQRMGERRDKALKELRDQLAAKQPSAPLSSEKHNFWETSGFKIVVSMSMLILVMFSKRSVSFRSKQRRPLEIDIVCPDF